MTFQSATMRYHFSPIGLAKIQKLDKMFCWQDCEQIDSNTAGRNAKWYNYYGGKLDNITPIYSLTQQPDSRN